MNDFTGKALLAAVRSGDFAHPGEEAGIDMTVARAGIARTGTALDAGCGRGGTARRLKILGFPEVVGVDVDAESIDYARAAYPDIEFHAGDLTRAQPALTGRFNTIFMFNVLYAIEDQVGALATLRGYAAAGGTVCIFDYVALNWAALDEAHPLSRTPSDLGRLRLDLTQAGWRVSAEIDVTERYLAWYSELVGRFARQDLQARFDTAYIEAARSKFARLLQCIEQGWLGGLIMTAAAA